MIDRLRAVRQDTHQNWVELLPYVLDRLHDTPGESGFSPYQIVFGRERPLEGLPLQTAPGGEDARFFLQRVKKLRMQAADILNKMHAKHARVERVPEKVYHPGDIVYYIRPENSGDKLDSRWVGPARVVARRSKRGYTIEVKPGHTIESPIAFLKPYNADQYSGEATGLHYHRRTPTAPQGEMHPQLIEKISGHRLTPAGNWEFRTNWLGDPEKKWEPMSSFFEGNSQELLNYCQEKKLPVEFVKGTPRK